MMDTKIKQPIRYTFSGHDTFHCRLLWLKKGVDLLNKGKKFTDEDAVIELGVGKNMVSSIYFWMKAFGLIDKIGELTHFATYIFGPDGKDPFLEDEATLWLLHFQLVTNNIATTYNLVFNEFRREKIEFTKDHFINFIIRKNNENNDTQLNKNTLSTDFEVFTKMYIRTDAQAKDKEDTFSGLLTELNLVQEEKRKVNDKSEVFYSIVTDEKVEIADEIILFGILESNPTGASVSFYTIEQDKNQVGSVFGIGKSGLINKIENITLNPKYKKYGIVFNDHAGIKELQFKKKPNSFEVLNNYYGN